jgi:hypothetical protein
MWSYQHYFRHSLEVRARSTLEAINFFGDPRVVLVGFQVAGDHEFDICIEPEDGPFRPEDFNNVHSRADELYSSHPDQDMRHSIPQMHETFHRRLRIWMRGRALEETFEAMPSEEGRSFFAGPSIRVGDYEVHALISVDKGTLARVPQIATEEFERVRIEKSIVHAAINEILRLAAQALERPEPGSDIRLPDINLHEVIRNAAGNMVGSLMFRAAGATDVSENHLLMNSLSALPYEGRAGSGRLIFSKIDDLAIEIILRLRQPISLNNIPAVRKLLEVSGLDIDLLSDGEYAYGLGFAKQNYDPASERIFVVSITGRGSWEISHAGEALLTIRDGVPSLPTRVLDEEYLEQLISRLFSEANPVALLEAARAVGDHSHGAMLVISADAAGEAARLSPQAWSIEPVHLTPEVLTRLTNMDGAVLVDLEGRCHAIGVILDGIAHGKGDPARGSRHNNVIRYLDSDTPPAIVIAYSSDGAVHILPQMRPRIAKHLVDEIVNNYLMIASTPSLNLKEANRAWDSVKSISFYLSPDQCNELNRARADVDERKKGMTNVWIVERDIRPHPDMNDEYWL